MRLRCAMSDPAMQDAFMGSNRCARSPASNRARMHPDDTTILKFRRLLQDNDLLLKLPTALTRA